MYKYDSSKVHLLKTDRMKKHQRLLFKNKMLTKLKIDMFECAADILINYLHTYMHKSFFVCFVF